MVEETPKDGIQEEGNHDLPSRDLRSIDMLNEIIAELKIKAREVAIKIGISEGELSRLRSRNFGNYRPDARMSVVNKIIQAYDLRVTERPAGSQPRFSIQLPEKKPGEEFTYVLYYANQEDEIERGLLELIPSTKKANLTLYHSSGDGFEPRVQYFDGEIVTMKGENKFSILFKNRKQYYNNDESIKPFFCSFKGDIEDKTQPMKAGVYSTTDTLSSGNALIILQSPEENSIAAEIPIIVRYSLSNTYVSIMRLSKIIDEPQMLHMRFSRALNIIKGIYEGFALILFNESLSVAKMVFDIDEIGNVKINSSHYIGLREGKVIEIVANNYACIQLNKEKKSENFTNFCLVNLKTTYLKRHEYVLHYDSLGNVKHIDFYEGIITSFIIRNSLFAGPFVLVRSDKNFHDLEPELIEISNRNDFLNIVHAVPNGEIVYSTFIDFLQLNK